MYSQTFSALTGSKSDSSLLESVYRPTKAMEDSTDPVTEAIGDVVDNRTKTALGVAGAAAVAEETRRLRRSKKEVLAERNVDIDKVNFFCSSSRRLVSIAKRYLFS